METFFVHEEFSEQKSIPLSPREALCYLQHGAAILDIRPEYETNYRVFDFPHVYLLPFSSYRENFDEVPKCIPLIVVDNVGLKSSEVAKFFIEQGYTQVAYVVGGVVAWEQNGLPIKKDLDYELNGGCACMLKPKK